MGKLTEAIKRLIDTLQISSASPGHINEVLQIDPSVDIDQALDESRDESAPKETKAINDTVKKVKKWDDTNIGDINRFTSQQFGNVRELATDPTGFIIRTFIKKFAKGVGIIALALIIFEAVKWVISEMLKPGRFLDLRFRRDITKEIIAFRRREDQQKLKQGFSNIIITTTSGLRGGQNQIHNTLDDVRRGTFPDQIGASNILFEAAGTSLSKGKGQGRRNFNRGVG